jgi:tetratricopeptide (TPR) repeat protein
MRKLLVVASLLVSTTALMAQEGTKIVTAVIAIDRNQDIVEAKKYIDEAAGIIATKPLSEIGSKDLSKFYYYKGLINYRIHNSDKPAIKALDSNALDKALDGFTMLIKHEKENKQRYTKEAINQIQYVANSVAQRAIDASKNEDYTTAYTDFLRTYEIKKSIPDKALTDTAMLYNAAIMAQNAKMYDKALMHNQTLKDMEYKGVTYKAKNVESGEETVFPSKRMMENMVRSGKFAEPKAEGDIRPNVYVTIANLALNQGDTALFEATVNEGRKRFPENKALIESELSIYFTNREFDKALAILDLAIANAEGDKKVVMNYNKGVILQNEIGRPNDALKAYEDALALDSMYSDALYMTSIIYIDSANAISSKMNELPLSANKKYEALKASQKKVFEAALPFLEKAYQSSPDDTQVVTALRQVYRQLRMFDKANALPAE